MASQKSNLPLKLSSFNFDMILVFLEKNAVLLFLIFSLYFKQVFITKEINGYFPPYPLMLYPLVFSGLISFLLFVPFFFLKKHKNRSAIFFAFLLSLIILADLTYSHYYNSIPSFAQLNLFGQTKDVAPAVIQVFSFLDLLYFIDLPIAVFLSKKLNNQSKNTIEKKDFLTPAMVLIGIIAIAVAFFYDSDKFIVEAKNNVMDNAIVMEHYGIFGSHFFDIYRNIAFEKITEVEKAEVVEWVKKNIKYPEKNEYTGVAKNKNVIMIQVESLQGFVLGKTVEGQEITPNLNKLLNESHNFDNHYFQMGAGSTSDIDLVTNTSFYPLKDAAAFVKYGRDDFSSLPKELKQLNYSSNVYHGYNRSFWNRETALESLGYEKFFAAESYPKDRIINMGLNDKTFLSTTAELIKNQPKPSFSYVITLSNHFPFHLDDDLKGLKLDRNKYPELSYNYLNTVNYTDQALGEFLDRLKKDGLYDDSVIVLYGDHSAKIDAFNLDNYSFDPMRIEDRRVPFLIKLPNQKKSVRHEQVSSHIDIMPTILNLVGAAPKSLMFGTDLFSGKKTFYSAVSYFDEVTIMSDGKLFRLIAGASTCLNIPDKASANCAKLLTKRAEDQRISDKIIRFNLFNQLGL